MGGTESSEGRRVSFGMDEEERVRVLQGIRLSENVVNRMKDSNQPSKVGQLTFPPAPPPSTLGTSKGPEKDSRLSRSEYGGSQPPSGVEEDLLKRYKQEQAVVQDELFQVVTREREAATKYRSAFLHQGEGSVDQEKQKSALLNAELYKLSSRQFHEAASKMEGTIKPRSLQPVCSGLQAQILRCYSDHLPEVLLCSDLVKAYQHCVTTAHKKSIFDLTPEGPQYQTLQLHPVCGRVEKQPFFLTLAMTWSPEEGTSYGTAAYRPPGLSHFLPDAYDAPGAWGHHVLKKWRMCYCLETNKATIFVFSHFHSWQTVTAASSVQPCAEPSHVG